MKPFVSGGFTVSAVRKANIGDVFTDGGGDRYFKTNIKMISLDEKTGAEIESPFNVLILADNFEKAVEKLNAGMKGTISDYRIHSISETEIIDIFTYKAS